PARSPPARRPDRDHARRQGRPTRHARRARQLAGRRLRAELHPRYPTQPRTDAALDHEGRGTRRDRRSRTARRNDRAGRGARHRRQRAAGAGRRKRQGRRRRRPHRRPERDRRRGRLTAVATATDYAAPAIATPGPRPGWRGRPGRVVGVVLAMVIGYLGWKSSLPWSNRLVWNSLSSYLDRFQTWLSDSRNTPHPSFVFAIFNGLATFLDNLVSWFTTFFEKLTWVGTVALGTLVVVRFGHWRQAIGVLAAFASFALMGLWEESVQTFALVFAAVGLSL